MSMTGTRLALAAFALLVASLGLPAIAQDDNLLQQGDFEDDYANRSRVDLNIPRRWGLWLQPDAEHPDWQNHIFAFPHRAQPEVHGGSASLNLSGGYIRYTAAIHQQVFLTPNTPLEATAWAWLHTCNFPRDRNNNIVGGICDSEARFNARVRIGIDPNGGTSPMSENIIWSDFASPHDRWEEISVQASASSAVVTVFLYVTQDTPSDLNNVYWDDASLRVVDAVTSPSATPALTSGSSIGPVSVATVVPSSVPGLYVVQPGDTFDRIALRFTLSRDELLALNPGTDPRRLRVGDTLRVVAVP
jgi:LysM repeat protein